MSYTPYSERFQWDDIEGLPQADAEDGLVPIMYTAEYKDALSYFRAIVVRDEKSERVLELTEHVIRLNPAHYTVWQYRLSTLLHLRSNLHTELQLMNSFATENLKSYQVWHHRLLLMTHLSPDLEGLRTEVEFIHESLLPDPKNYHTWAYLHWLYSHFSTLPSGEDAEVAGSGSGSGSNGTVQTISRFGEPEWEAEQVWCEEMLGPPSPVYGQVDEDGEELMKGDGRNNSAWGWRWFLMVARKGARRNARNEVEYALEQIRKIPHNASAWNYLRGIHKYFSIPLSQSLPSLICYTTIPPLTACSPTALPSTDTSTNPDTPLPVVPYSLEWLADVQAEEGRWADAAALYKELAERWDLMRKTYWTHRQIEALKKMAKQKHPPVRDEAHGADAPIAV